MLSHNYTANMIETYLVQIVFIAFYSLAEYHNKTIYLVLDIIILE
jgi:hypothetical protein